jgi:hypothetical protein
MITNYIIFDLDETLGHFPQLGVIVDTIEQMSNHKMSQKTFNQLCDRFSEVFRPGIFLVLRYLKRQKMKHKALKIVIYTNNNGPKSWAKKIYRYLHHKIKYKLFDQSIGAYKILDKLIEKNRTTHNKTIADFKSCTNAPNKSAFCFIDDQYHPHMHDDNVYYIHITPYIKEFSLHEIIKLLKPMGISDDIINKIKINMDQFNFHSNIIHKEKEKAVTRDMLAHIQEFLKKSRTTQKHRSIFNRTRKRIKY